MYYYLAQYSCKTCNDFKQQDINWACFNMDAVVWDIYVVWSEDDLELDLGLANKTPRIKQLRNILKHFYNIIFNTQYSPIKRIITITISRCGFLICKLEVSNVSWWIYAIHVCKSSVKYSLSFSLFKSISITIEETT